jgi:hypothetical protein
MYWCGVDEILVALPLKTLNKRWTSALPLCPCCGSKTKRGVERRRKRMQIPGEITALRIKLRDVNAARKALMALIAGHAAGETTDLLRLV